MTIISGKWVSKINVISHLNFEILHTFHMKRWNADNNDKRIEKDTILQLLPHYLKHSHKSTMSKEEKMYLNIHNKVCLLDSRKHQNTKISFKKTEILIKPTKQTHKYHYNTFTNIYFAEIYQNTQENSPF